MYNLKRTFWEDHVEDEEGKVIQQGTMQDQAHFNNGELGISDAHLAQSIMLLDMMQHRRVDESKMESYQEQTEAAEAEIYAEILGENHEITLTNTESYPFNSTVDKPTTVSLTKTRKNLFYTVEAMVKAATGTPGQIHITDKALNGFKVYYDGSATSVTLTLRIKGGMA